MARRYGSFSGGPRVAFYGLGRLGSGGVDYGSDLDILITYDSLVPSPIKSLTQDETYSRLVEFMIAALSSITREGYLYRVDMRLRPHGKNGPLVTSAEGFLDYLKEESAPWERSEEHTSELQSRRDLVCRLLLEKKKINNEIYKCI